MVNKQVFQFITSVESQFLTWCSIFVALDRTKPSTVCCALYLPNVYDVGGARSSTVIVVENKIGDSNSDSE